MSTDPARDPLVVAEQLAALRVDLATVSAEVRAVRQLLDPAVADHETRIRSLEQRPQHDDVPDRLRAVERWQWQREALLTLSGGGVGAALLAVITSITGG